MTKGSPSLKHPEPPPTAYVHCCQRRMRVHVSTSECRKLPALQQALEPKSVWWRTLDYSILLSDLHTPLRSLGAYCRSVIRHQGQPPAILLLPLHFQLGQ